MEKFFPFFIIAKDSKVVNMYFGCKFPHTNMQNKLGLSLGDKACISLGILMNLTVCSTDRIWGKVKVENLKINLLR